MKKPNWAAIALMMATVMTVGCSSSSDEDAPQPVIDPVDLPTTLELTRAEQEMVNSSNDFAFNLFRMAQDEKESQILSPISITYALGMLNNGAAGETQEQINHVLGFSETKSNGINEFCYKMLQKASTLDEQTKVMIANNIYFNTDWKTKYGHPAMELFPTFVSTAKAFYDAEPESRSFSDGKTRDVINQWASDHTEGMIEEVLKEDEFNTHFISYLLNAIYFKGTWQHPFDKNMTIDEEFNHAGSTKEEMIKPMMRQTADFDYTETETLQALRLPYGNGLFQMTVLLPKGETNAVPQAPTADLWQKIQQQMRPVEVDVKLPRFESDTDINLIPIMKKLGMIRAFDEELAEFPYLCIDPPVYIWIATMKQVAKIKLNEEGTEAAAVTVVGVDGKNGFMPNIVRFHANHPFLYVISEKTTGAIFFIGQYTGY